MFKRVDVNEQEPIEGFCYISGDGEEERVVIDDGNKTIVLQDGDECEVNRIYVSDIPKLILALQAAYDYLEKK